MVVIAHQAVGMARPLKALADLAQHLEKHRPIGIIEIDVLTPITSRRDVVKRASELNAKGPSHAFESTPNSAQIQNSRPDPLLLLKSVPFVSDPLI